MPSLEELAGCRIIREPRVIELPLSGRPEALVRRLARAAGEVACGRATYRLLVLRCRGFPSYGLVWAAEAYTVATENIVALDELSGLRLQLRAPVLRLDGCTAELTWRRTRFELSCAQLERCEACVKVSERQLATLLDRLCRSRL